MKICKKCEIELDISLFGRNVKSKDGFKNICRICLRKDAELYRIKNREDINKRSNKHYHDNKEKRKKYNDINSEVLKEKKRIYYIKNKDRIKEYNENNKEIRNRKRRLNNNKLYRIKNSIRTSIGRSIRINGYTKKSKTYEILGCTFKEFKLYLESKFESWMNWDNYGLYCGEFNFGWDIDHIIPISSADSEETLIKLNHYTNLQPLCSKINRDIKKNNYKEDNF